MHIDDSQNERQLVKQAVFLTQTPFEVFEADSLESAIPFFQIHWHDEENLYVRPAAVLLDYDLGNETGADFLYWVRKKKGITSIPIIMFTGSVGNPYAEECYASGANYFLRKPESLSRLKVIVRTLHSELVSPHPHSLLSLLQEFIPDPRTCVTVSSP